MVSTRTRRVLNERISVRVNVDGLFSWLCQYAHRICMASGAVVSLEEVYLVVRILIEELGDETR
jgi:hypothetical protein